MASINYRFDDIENMVCERELFIPLDILLIGSTGTGKSSTLNALFDKKVAKVGEGVDPQTQHISANSLHKYFRFHDTPGLGDGIANDIRHSKDISEKLQRQIWTAKGLVYGNIDLVLIILDSASRDFGTVFKILENIVLKNIDADRVIIAINRADMAKSGSGWNRIQCNPNITLLNYLKKQAASVKIRIKESTGCNIKIPIFYSALYNYNIDKLFDHIINHIPHNRRIILDERLRK